MKYLMQRQLGFSLVEIMVGMTLGLFLTIGIIQLYIGSNRNYSFQSAFSATQENGRFALEVLNNSIRMTNFTGCSINGIDVPPTVTNILGLDLDNSDNWWANVSQGWNGMLRGYDGNANDFPGKAFRTNIPYNPGERIPDTDAIISLGGTGSYSVTAADTLTLTLAQIQKINGGNIQTGDILWICNDTNIILFQVTNINGNTITHDDFTQGISYLDNTAIQYATEVTEYVPTAFYIGVSAAGTSLSLYQIRLVIENGDAKMEEEEEILEGVENMQIFYGVDTSATPDRIADVYVDASDVPDMDASGVADWERVVSVRIELLLASMEDNVLSQPQTYFFPKDTGDSATTGRSVTATDKRWYQVFSTTIGIRSRLP